MSKCKSCGSELIWVKSDQGKSIPFDARQTVLLVPDLNGNNVLTKGHVCHFVTCPHADQFRKKEG